MTTDAVLTDAWQLPKEIKLVLLFANVSDVPVSATLSLNVASYGIRARQLKLLVTGSSGVVNEAQTTRGRFERKMEFQPCQAQAWELSW